VYEEDVNGGPDRKFAAALADKQRDRIESPSEPSAPEDDREVGLSDPAIAVPVYWLGLEFEPEGLPKLELYRGDYLGGGHGPGAEVKIARGDGGSRQGAPAAAVTVAQDPGPRPQSRSCYRRPRHSPTLLHTPAR
jgi:hypothetical protein